MQLFLLGYLIIEICEIFTVGEFPLAAKVRIVSLSSHMIPRPTGSDPLGLHRNTSWHDCCNHMDSDAQRGGGIPNSRRRHDPVSRPLRCLRRRVLHRNRLHRARYRLRMDQHFHIEPVPPKSEYWSVRPVSTRATD